MEQDPIQDDQSTQGVPGQSPEAVPRQSSEAMPDGSADAATMAAQVEMRQRLHAKFDAWLDRMLADEASPEGIPAELLEDAAGQSGRECDLYTVFASLTGLTGEIRLQGRAFKQLADGLAPMADLGQRIGRLEEMQSAAADQLEALVQSQEQVDTEQVLPAANAVLEVVFDLHSRLQRQLQTIDQIQRTARPDGAMARLFAARALARTTASAADMREACRLMLARLEAALHQWGIEPIGRIGDPFDPECMTAIEVQAAADADDGTVLEVYRLGYAICGQTLSAAQVKVARSKDTQA